MIRHLFTILLLTCILHAMTLSLLLKMKLSGTRVGFIIVLPAFAKLGALHYVSYLHGYSLKTRVTLCVFKIEVRAQGEATKAKGGRKRIRRVILQLVPLFMSHCAHVFFVNFGL